MAVAGCPEGDLTHKELLERADAVARRLSSLGAERPVAIDVNAEAVSHEVSLATDKAESSPFR